MHGVLLVNVGSPKSAKKSDVRRFLHQFLIDKRVIPYQRLLREFLVKAIIVPLRLKKISAIYNELGRPLIENSTALKKSLQDALGADFQVEIGMRYQEPSLKRALEQLQSADTLTILPLFPQYASATTGSVFEESMRIMQAWDSFPSKKITFINSFWNHPLFLEAWTKRGREYAIDSYDHVLFSFHGLPIKQDPGLQYKTACENCAKAIACLLKIPEKRYTVSFQSRLGREEWLTPYTTDTIERLAKKGVKKLLVFSPAFVSDCIETTYELGVEGKMDFQKAGGETLDLVESLNTSPDWIFALQTIVKEHI